jgi:hypothetical protein
VAFAVLYVKEVYAMHNLMNLMGAQLLLSELIQEDYHIKQNAAKTSNPTNVDTTDLINKHFEFLDRLSEFFD